jgi:two-component system NtrC family sensor kinase
MAFRKEVPIMNIGVVGGSLFAREVVEKLTMDYSKEAVNARLKAIADPDPEAPALVLGRRLGLITVTDYHDLYDPRYDIDLMMILVPGEKLLEEILESKPAHIRVLSYQVFEVTWKSIRVEEEKLRERTAEMETILNGIQDYILLVTPDRRIIEANEAYLRDFGYSREEVVGQKCHEIFQNSPSPCSNGDVNCPLSKAIQNRRPSQKVLTRKGKDGELHYFEVTIFPVWEKDGKVSKFVEISRNITDRKKQEEEITRRLEQMVEERTAQVKEAHEKLIHQDKMASLGKLSASVVHEINNPIAGSLTLIMLIKRILEEEELSKNEIEKFKQYLDLMETQTRRISRITSNLLAFSRQSKMELKRVNLNHLIEQTLILTSNLLKINGVKAEINLAPDLPEVVGSDDQLQQAFMNFVSNAAEAMVSTEGGTLTIETRPIDEGDRVQVRFIDRGIGIQRENLTKLFEPFFTTKKKGKGVGLGLSVAYGIIQEHGGLIIVESQPGKATTLDVRIPVNGPLEVTN